MDDIIAVLEDDPGRTKAMTEALDRELPGVEVVFFDNAPDITEWLRDNLGRVRLLCLDHDLGPNRERDGEVFDPGIGRDVVEFLESQPPGCPVLIHSSNSPAADVMMYALQFEDWSADRIVPFGDLDWVEDRWIGRVVSLWNDGAGPDG